MVFPPILTNNSPELLVDRSTPLLKCIVDSSTNNSLVHISSNFAPDDPILDVVLRGLICSTVIVVELLAPIDNDKIISSQSVNIFPSLPVI